MRYLLSLVSILLFTKVDSQIINPRIWYLGYQSVDKRDTTSPDTEPKILSFGANVLDFRKSPIKITRNGYALSLLACNVQLFDNNDSLIIYSNGSKIFNGKHRLVEGGDSLSYGSDWVTSPMAGNYYGEYLVGVFHNAMVALPSVKKLNQYYFVSIFISRDFNLFPKLVYSKVDMSLNGGKGRVIEKEVLIKSGEFAPAIEACRHGNGRDWWIITREYGKKNFIIMLLDSTGIRVVSEPVVSGWSLADWDGIKGNPTNRFSWDGTMFVSFTHLGAELFNFNRCTGALSNRREILLPPNDSFFGGIGGFSPNSKLLYIGNRQYYYQVDIFNGLKMRNIATNDGYKDTPIGQTGGIPTDFGLPQLAADGKIYMTTTETTRYLHTIENPNDTGILCNFKQHSIKLLTFNSGLPHYPNYELGAVADKCGESGITDNEIEKIEVYPNPASDFVEISPSTVIQSPTTVIPLSTVIQPRYISGLFRNLSITFTNLLGQSLSPPVIPISTVIPANLSGSQHHEAGISLDVRSLPEGIYLLQIKDKNDNLIKTERIVIAR